MAATSFDPRNPKIISRYGIAPLNSSSVGEGASQSFKAGELVTLDASGAVSVAATGASTAIFGIAQEDAAGSASNNITVQQIGAEDEIVMLITDASGSGAAYTNCVVGQDYDLLVTSGIHSVNHADTTNPVFVFTGGINDATGTATNYGRFRVLPALVQLQAG